MKAPSFQWYPKDCDTDERVRAMDDREFGFYMRCLNHSWLNNGLPAEMGELARVMGRTKPYTCKIWERVGRCFEIRDDRFVNPKQEDQRKEASDFQQSRRNAANIRWGNETPCKTDARALHPECPASASASASASALPHTHTSVRAVLPTLRKPNADDMNGQTSPNFETWFGIWSGVRGNAHRSGACQAYISTVLLAAEADAISCTVSYVKGPGADPAHGYRPDNFLFEMARDGFKTRWPAQRAGPQRQESVMEQAKRLAKEKSNGTR